MLAKLRSVAVSISALFLCLLCGGCYWHLPPRPGPAITTPPWQDDPAHPFVLAPEKRTSLIAALKILKPGDDINEVLARVGPPDQDSVLTPKVWYPWNKPWCGRGWRYRFDEVGHGVELFFNQKGKLMDLFSTIPEVSSFCAPELNDFGK